MDVVVIKNHITSISAPSCRVSQFSLGDAAHFLCPSTFTCSRRNSENWCSVTSPSCWLRNLDSRMLCICMIYLTRLNLWPPWQPRPDPEVRKRNYALVELVLGPDDPVKHPAGVNHWERAKDLLRLDTGSWGDQTHIWHHCGGIFCCPNGIRESKLKIWAAVIVPSLINFGEVFQNSGNTGMGIHFVLISNVEHFQVFIYWIWYWLMNHWWLDDCKPLQPWPTALYKH